jgi:hypothetical protein
MKVLPETAVVHFGRNGIIVYLQISIPVAAISARSVMVLICVHWEKGLNIIFFQWLIFEQHFRRNEQQSIELEVVPLLWLDVRVV